MKFDELCKLVLEGVKSKQFARIHVVDPQPMFDLSDVSRDPSDSSKGLKTYLDDKGVVDEAGNIDYDRIARRALRRINWVARTAIKKIGNREVDLKKLHQTMIASLEGYLRGVMGVDDSEIASKKMRIAKEATFIGNLLLPKTAKLPNAKHVFEPVKGTKMSPDQLSAEFEQLLNDMIEMYDPDLIGIIKKVVKEGIVADQDAESSEYADVRGAATVGDVLRDRRIRNVYEPGVVRRVIKELINIGSLHEDEQGGLTIDGDESTPIGKFAAKMSKVSSKGEDIDSDSAGELESTATSDIDIKPSAKDSAEGVEPEVHTTDSEGAASRLGYDSEDGEAEDASDSTEDDENNDFNDAVKRYLGK